MSKGSEQGIKNTDKCKHIHTLSRWEVVSSLLELQIEMIGYGLPFVPSYQMAKRKKDRIHSIGKSQRTGRRDVLLVQIL